MSPTLMISPHARKKNTVTNSGKNEQSEPARDESDQPDKVPVVPDQVPVVKDTAADDRITIRLNRVRLRL